MSYRVKSVWCCHLSKPKQVQPKLKELKPYLCIDSESVCSKPGKFKFFFHYLRTKLSNLINFDFNFIRGRYMFSGEKNYYTLEH